MAGIYPCQRRCDASHHCISALNLSQVTAALPPYWRAALFLPGGVSLCLHSASCTDMYVLGDTHTCLSGQSLTNFFCLFRTAALPPSLPCAAVHIMVVSLLALGTAIHPNNNRWTRRALHTQRLTVKWLDMPCTAHPTTDSQLLQEHLQPMYCFTIQASWPWASLPGRRA